MSKANVISKLAPRVAPNNDRQLMARAQQQPITILPQPHQQFSIDSNIYSIPMSGSSYPFYPYMSYPSVIFENRGRRAVIDKEGEPIVMIERWRSPPEVRRDRSFSRRSSWSRLNWSHSPRISPHLRPPAKKKSDCCFRSFVTFFMIIAILVMLYLVLERHLPSVSIFFQGMWKLLVVAITNSTNVTVQPFTTLVPPTLGGKQASDEHEFFIISSREVLDILDKLDLSVEQYLRYCSLDDQSREKHLSKQCEVDWRRFKNDLNKALNADVEMNIDDGNRSQMFKFNWQLKGFDEIGLYITPQLKGSTLSYLIDLQTDSNNTYTPDLLMPLDGHRFLMIFARNGVNKLSFCILDLMDESSDCLRREVVGKRNEEERDMNEIV